MVLSGAIFAYKTSRSTANLITVQVEQLKSNNSSRKVKKRRNMVYFLVDFMPLSVLHAVLLGMLYVGHSFDSNYAWPTNYLTRLPFNCE
jgi:hypothetical protein